MDIKVYFQDEEQWIVEMPNNTKQVTFDIDRENDWPHTVVIKDIEFYEETKNGVA